MATYNTIFDTTVPGGTYEKFEITVEYDVDQNADTYNDIKVTIKHSADTNSGTEDDIGVAFDLSSFTGISIQDVTVIDFVAGSGAAFVPTSGISQDKVTDDGGAGTTDPGFNISGGGVDEPYDAYVKVSNQGASDGAVQSFSFVLTTDGSVSPYHLDFNTVLNNTDWYIRTQSSDGGEGSSKTLGYICFAPGSLIATPGGERAVEALAIGDLVLTASGQAVPIKWIGRQTVFPWISVSEKMEPVRFRKGALGGGLPHSDLIVTADHGMIVDGLVINASALVNGTTIEFVPVSELPHLITYYHIETENHDVILANGAPSETFVDVPGRRGFDNYQEYLELYGAERIITEMRAPRITCRRMLPDTIRARLGIVDDIVDFDDLGGPFAEALTA